MSGLTKDEETTQKTYDQMAKTWASSHEIDDFWAAEVATFHRYLPSGRILEIGAGSGRDVKLLLAQGYDYIGTDFSAGLLEQARQANPGVNFQQVSVYDLAFEKPFDGFWCAAMLLHIPKRRLPEAFTAIYKSVKPGAVGFISVKKGDKEGMEEKVGHRRLVAYWQTKAFTQVLNQVGFEVIWKGQKPYQNSVWLTFIVRAI